MQLSVLIITHYSRGRGREGRLLLFNSVKVAEVWRRQSASKTPQRRAKKRRSDGSGCKKKKKEKKRGFVMKVSASKRRDSDATSLLLFFSPSRNAKVTLALISQESEHICRGKNKKIPNLLLGIHISHSFHFPVRSANEVCSILSTRVTKTSWSCRNSSHRVFQFL